MARWWMTLAMVVMVSSTRARAEDLDASEIMRRNFTVGKVSDSRAEVTMTLVS